MKRAVSVAKLLSKKMEVYQFDGIWQQAMGNPEKNGLWLIYGREKNGKTWFALKVAEYLSKFGKVEYISAEEGVGPNFQASCKRARLDATNPNLKFREYTPMKEVYELLTRRYRPDVILIDNTSIYGSELRSADIVQLMRQENVLFVVLAHEKRGEPDGAAANMAKKMAKVIMRVEGLTAHVSGRVPGGAISIDETKAALYWGAEVRDEGLTINN